MLAYIIVPPPPPTTGCISRDQGLFAPRPTMITTENKFYIGPNIYGLSIINDILKLEMVSLKTVTKLL